MAHALWGYEGPCKNVHGHSYKLFISVAGQIKDDGSSPDEAMVIDFSALKKIVHENIISRYDHSLVLDQNIPEEMKRAAEVMSKKIVYIKGMPTCEALAVIFARILKDRFPAGIILHHLKLQETATSFAEWYASENP